MDAYKPAEKVPSTNSLLLKWTFMTHRHGEGVGAGALFLGNGANSGPIQARSFAGSGTGVADHFKTCTIP